MSYGLYNPSAQYTPERIVPPVLWVKRRWGDAWQFAPELELQSMTLAAGSDDLSRAVVQRRYGYLRWPWQLTPSLQSATVTPSGWWLLVAIGSPGGYVPQWMGQIQGDSRNVFGSIERGASGQQTYTAYGGQQILRKIAVSTAYWADPDGGDAHELGWLPGLNAPFDGDEFSQVTQAAAGDATSELHGHVASWNNLQYVRYLIARYVDGQSTGGPAWEVRGQLDGLAERFDVIRWEETETVDAMLRKLIPRRHGYEYMVYPSTEGFVLWVWTVTPEPIRYGAGILPANPRTHQAVLGTDHRTTRANVVTSDEHGYKAIRLLGSRVVCCCSLWGENNTDAQALGVDGTLDQGWVANVETQWKTAGADARRSDWYRYVWQRFVAADDWEFQDGDAAPQVAADGTLADAAAPFQTAIRRTLPWTPLKFGTDYTQDPAVEADAAWINPGLLPPAVWIAVPNPLYDGVDETDLFVYRPADELGFHVSALDNGLGLTVRGDPTHALADGHLAGVTVDEPALYDYRNMAMTLAFETDHRFGLLWQPPDWTPSDGILDIEIEGAEWWYLAPHTIVGIDEDGQVQTSGAEGRVIRNDSERLIAELAGVMARYGASRHRAEVRTSNLRPWGFLPGSILTGLYDGTSWQSLRAPITSVEWRGGHRPETVLRAGYAR